MAKHSPAERRHQGIQQKEGGNVGDIKVEVIRETMMLSDEQCFAVLSILDAEKGGQLSSCGAGNKAFYERVIGILMGITPCDTIPATIISTAVELVRSQMDGIA